jgi:hypothetical protein
VLVIVYLFLFWMFAQRWILGPTASDEIEVIA